MKIVLIGPGYSPIPPTGWGAVESLIWDYYENLKKRNVDVTIINEKNLHIVIKECNEMNPDIVHIMYDDYIVISPHLTCRKIYYSSHYAYITHPQFKTKYNYYYNNIFKRVIENQQYITIHAISKEIADIYKENGFQGTINVICNGAREDLFKYTNYPSKSDKSVYVAKIEFRKAQYKYQRIENIDFVGNYHDSPFQTSAKNYLGEWNKPTLYENLTNYANLILLSEGEADPLVVKEALVAGLGLVISECCSANLDLSKPFITVIPNDKLDDLKYISEKIAENRKYCIANREQIRNYGLQYFAWNSIVAKYLDQITK